MAKRYTDAFRRDAVRMATTSGLERFQFSLQQGYRQCPESAEGVAGCWRSNINWKRFRWQKPLGIRTKGRINAFRDRNVNATSPGYGAKFMSPLPKRQRLSPCKNRFSRIVGLLPVPQLRIAPAFGQERFVGASLCNLAGLKDDDLVRFGDRA